MERHRFRVLAPGLKVPRAQAITSGTSRFPLSRTHIEADLTPSRVARRHTRAGAGFGGAELSPTCVLNGFQPSDDQSSRMYGHTEER